MANVIGSIPGLYGGVSQQSPVMRLETQCELSDNTHATVADGLMKRPNTDHVALMGLVPDSPGTPLFHKIYRDRNEKYIAMLSADSGHPIRVWDLSGNEQAVRYGHLDAELNFTEDATVKAYLTTGVTNPKTQFKAVSVADYTFIVNTQKECAMTTATSPSREDAGVVWCKKWSAGLWSITAKWTEGGVEHTSTTEETWAPDVVIDCHYVCKWLADQWTDVQAKFTVESPGSLIVITPLAGSGVDPGSLTLSTQDPFGSGGFSVISKAAVSDLDDIPPQLPVSMTVQVAGDQNENQDDYYLKYDPETHFWTETLGWDIPFELDAGTLPHRLVRTAVGEFTFAPAIWEDRMVGDEDTNTVPSFIGETINNVRFYKNRLWFFSNVNIVGSRVSEYFNFWASTTLTIVDDDPVDVAAAGEQVSFIRSAQGFDKGLLLLSDEEQFAMTAGDQPITPTSVAIDSTTSFSADIDAEPIKIGPDVYFVSPKGTYVGIRQYSIMPDTLVQDAYDITSHVPKYIQKGAACILGGCNQLDMLFLHTDADPSSLYVHQFLWNGNQKVQQAWYRWELSHAIFGFKVFGTTLYVVLYDALNGLMLEKLELEAIPYPGEPFRYHIDSLLKLTGGNYSNPNSIFTLPLSLGTDADAIEVVDGTTHSPVTAPFAVKGNTLTIYGANYSGKPVFVGRKYTMRHRLSEWYIRDSEKRAVIAGTLQVRNLTLSFKSTGYFRVEVTALGRDTMVAEEMTGLRVGETLIGSATLLSGEKHFQVLADSKTVNVDIVSDSYQPMFIQSGAWTGTHTVKGTIV